MIHIIKSRWDQLTNTNTAKVHTFEPFYLEWFDMHSLLSAIAGKTHSQSDHEEITQMIMETIHYEMMHELLLHIPEDHHEIVVERVHQSEPFEMIINTIDVADELLKKKLLKKASEVHTIIMVKLEE